MKEAKVESREEMKNYFEEKKMYWIKISESKLILGARKKVQVDFVIKEIANYEKKINCIKDQNTKFIYDDEKKKKKAILMSVLYSISSHSPLFLYLYPLYLS